MRFRKSAVLCAVLALSGARGYCETLPLVRYTGEANVDVGNGPVNASGMADDSLVVGDSIAMGSASAVPATNTTGYSVQVTAASQEISHGPATLPASASALIGATVQEGTGSDPGGWCTATLLLTVSELNSTARGGAGASSISLNYDGGVLFWAAPGDDIGPLDEGSSVVVSEYVYIDQGFFVTAWGQVGINGVVPSASNISTGASAFVESAPAPSGQNFFTIFNSNSLPVVVEY